MAESQTYKNYARWDPPYHFFALPVMLVNVILTIVYVVRHFAQHAHIGIWMIVVSLALLVTCLKARMFALAAQDRLIRLEEKLRLAQLCSPGELAELESLTIPQYVALRFASNPELPELARRAVRENLTPKQIKQSVAAWRPDHDRV